jgi:hypothetical protein
VRAVQFLDVVWTGSRFVAASTATAGGGAFLDSSDGLTWHLQDGVVGFPDALASAPRGIVAVGNDANGRPVSWSSRDGLTWSGPTGTFGKGAGDDTITVTDVVATDDGWLAVGSEDPACQTNCGLDPIRALVWISGDGLTWTRLADRPAFKGAAMLSVTMAGDGLVAVGSSGLVAAAWTSSDGTTWVRSADAHVLHTALSADGEGAAQMSSVAFGRGVIVAVGTEFPMSGDAPRTARAWWSTDGATWVEGTGDAFPESQLFTVAATRSGFLGSGPSGAPGCRGGLWESADGRSWTCTTSASGYEGMAPYAAAASPTIEIVVGFDSSVESDHGFPGAVWWRTVP